MPAAAEAQWAKWFVQLSGTIMSTWNAADMEEAARNGRTVRHSASSAAATRNLLTSRNPQVPPHYLNLQDAFLHPFPPSPRGPKTPTAFQFALNSAGANRILFCAPSLQSLTVRLRGQWMTFRSNLMSDHTRRCGSMRSACRSGSARAATRSGPARFSACGNLALWDGKASRQAFLLRATANMHLRCRDASKAGSKRACRAIPSGVASGRLSSAARTCRRDRVAQRRRRLLPSRRKSRSGVACSALVQRRTRRKSLRSSRWRNCRARAPTARSPSSNASPRKAISRFASRSMSSTVSRSGCRTPAEEQN